MTSELEQLRALLKECVPYLDELAESLQCEDLDDDADMVSKLGSRIAVRLADAALAEEARTRSKA